MDTDTILLDPNLTCGHRDHDHGPIINTKIKPNTKVFCTNAAFRILRGREEKKRSNLIANLPLNSQTPESKYVINI